MDSREKWFRQGNYITGGLFVALGLFMSIYALTQYSYMDRYSLGPAFYPAWIGGFIVLLGLLIIYQNHKNRYLEQKKKVPTREAANRMALFVIMCILFLVVVNFLGMVISLILFLLAVNRMIAQNTWKRSIPMAVLTTLGIYLVFHVIFYINFPEGFLGF